MEVGVKVEAPTVLHVPQNVASSFWLLYSVVIQSALLADSTNETSSIMPSKRYSEPAGIHDPMEKSKPPWFELAYVLVP